MPFNFNNFEIVVRDQIIRWEDALTFLQRKTLDQILLMIECERGHSIGRANEMSLVNNWCSGNEERQISSHGMDTSNSIFVLVFFNIGTWVHVWI